MNDIITKLYDAYLVSRRVTTDSRAITPGCIFFAFKGEHFDGNAFAPQALEQGAAFCVMDDATYRTDDRCIVVEDVLATLQELAREHRRHLAIPVIGITGTNGKTTTKELVHSVLSKRYRTSATVGNFNNHLGVPLTLLSIPADAELAIVEMGANHPGEIAQLCGIADPDFGLITNVGRAHLEGFGSFEGVVQTKTELYRHLAARQGTVFVNADNPILTAQLSTLHSPLSTLVTYGSSQEADVRGTLVTDSSNPYLHFYFEVGDNVYNVRTSLLGDYNFDNCMAAVAVGVHFGVEPFDIKEAIEEYRPSNRRSQFRQTARNSLYLDCYNANPSSMAAAIASFRNISGQWPVASGQLTDATTAPTKLPTDNCPLTTKKVAVIGGMHELGADERLEHERLVQQLADCRLEQCLLVGPEFEGIALPKGFLLFPDTNSLRQWLEQHPLEGCTVLVKGSNTNRLWELEELL